MPAHRRGRVKPTLATKLPSSTPPTLRRSQRRALKSNQIVEKSSRSFSDLSLRESLPDLSTPLGQSRSAAVKSRPLQVYRTPKNPRLSALLYLPDYPQTVEEASIILSVARAGKDERVTREVVLRLALHQIIKHVKALALRGCNKEQEEADVGSLQRDLSAAAQDICDAEKDLGLIRSLVRRKGFPLEFDIERRKPERNSLGVTGNRSTNPKSYSITPSPVPSESGWEGSDALT